MARHGDKLALAAWAMVVLSGCVTETVIFVDAETNPGGVEPLPTVDTGSPDPEPDLPDPAPAEPDAVDPEPTAPEDVGGTKDPGEAEPDAPIPAPDAGGPEDDASPEPTPPPEPEPVTIVADGGGQEPEDVVDPEPSQPDVNPEPSEPDPAPVDEPEPPDEPDAKPADPEPSPLCSPEKLTVKLDAKAGQVVTGKYNFTSKVTGGCGEVVCEISIDWFDVKTDFVPPFSVQINTADPQWGDGEHIIAIYCQDSFGNTTSNQVKVVFDNTPPKFDTVSPTGGCAFWEDGGLVMKATTIDTNPWEYVRFHANGLLVKEFPLPTVKGPPDVYEVTVPWADIYVYEDELPATVTVEFIGKDKLGQMTPKDLYQYTITVHKRLLWQYDTQGEIWGTAALLPNSNLVFGTLGGKVFSFTQAGSQAWQQNLGSPINVGMSYYNSTDMVYFGSLDGKYYGFSTGGSTNWSIQIGSPGNRSTSANSVLFVPVFNKLLYALNPSNGSTNWTYSFPDYISSSPAVTSDGTAIVGCQDNKVYAIKDGGLKWSYETPNQVWSSGAIGCDGQTVYIGSNDGWVYALNLADGTKKWSKEVGSQIWGTLLVGADCDVYVASLPKFVTKLSQFDGAEKWAQKTEGVTYSSPVQDQKGTIYIGSSTGRVYAMHPDTGEILWTMPTPPAEAPNTFHASPTLHTSQGMLFIGGTNRIFYAMRTQCPN